MIPALERATVLRSAPLFARLAADELVALGAMAEEVVLQAGERVFSEDESGEALFVVVRGRVSVERGGRRTAELGPGECFGEISLLDEGPRSASVVALEAAELLRIARDDFLDMLSLYPGVVQSLLAILVRRLRGAEITAG